MAHSDDNTDKVKFEVPELPRLKKEGLVAVDMHFHTNHSDGHAALKNAMANAKDAGFGIAITDHNVVSGSLKAFRDKGDMLIVPGMEVSAFDGPHILMYFYSPGDLEDFFRKHIEPNRQKAPWLATKLTTPGILDRSEGYNCLVVAAHPYGYLLFNKGLQKCIDGGYLPPEITDRFDGLEVINGSMTHSLNVKAMRLVEGRNLSFTGGTDGHMLNDLGTTVTCAHADTLDGFLDAVKKRQNLVIGHEKGPIKKIATGVMVMAKHSRYFIPSMVINYQQNAHRPRHYLNRRRERKKDSPK